MNRATTSIRGLAFRYLSRRARCYLTGIPTMKELRGLLHITPKHGVRLARPKRTILRRVR